MDTPFFNYVYLRMFLVGRVLAGGLIIRVFRARAAFRVCDETAFGSKGGRLALLAPRAALPRPPRRALKAVSRLTASRTDHSGASEMGGIVDECAPA